MLSTYKLTHFGNAKSFTAVDRVMRIVETRTDTNTYLFDCMVFQAIFKNISLPSIRRRTVFYWEETRLPRGGWVGRALNMLSKFSSQSADVHILR